MVETRDCHAQYSIRSQWHHPRCLCEARQCRSNPGKWRWDCHAGLSL